MGGINIIIPIPKTAKNAEIRQFLSVFLLTKLPIWSINNLYLLLLISFKEDVVYYE
mgnify:CR=1 FL=1